MSTLLEYELVIRNADDTADLLVVSSVRGDALPYIVEAPSGDGAEFDPFTGSYRSGSSTYRIADAITSGTDRVVTSLLEDANFRQQLASKPAYGKERINGGEWVVRNAGIVTGVRLSSAAVWDIDVGDTTRATRNLVAFAPKRNATDATKVEPLADYLARWPHRGCMAGGPVLGGFLNRADLGGWEMRVADRVVAQTVTTNGDTRTWRTAYLSFVAGYQAPLFDRTTDASKVQERLNKAMGDGAGDYLEATFADDLPDRSLWPDVVVQIGNQYFPAASISNFPPKGPPENGFFSVNNRASGLFVWDSAQRLTVGSASVRVKVYDALPSERSPIYYSGHPIDLWTKLCDEAGLAYDSAAALATKQAIGTAKRINLRITGPQPWASFVEQTLYGPCGFSVRTGTDGTLIPFATRVTSSTLPGVEVTSADVPETGTVLFDLSEPDAITKVTFNQTNLLTVLDRTFTDVPPDGVAPQSVSVVRTSGDGGGPVQREQTYTIPGFLDTGSNAYEPGIVDALAAELFDRAGRGRLSGELALLREGSAGSVVLGDEVVVSLQAMPNRNKRLGDDPGVGGRCVQIVRLTPTPWGATAKFMDSGPNAQPATPLPTLALGTDAATREVWVMVTNAATLNAAGIAVRVQAVSVASGTPASTAYSDVLAFPAGAVPTGAVRLPSVPAGYTVYVRARSEQATKRPSAYSAPVSLATGAMGAPTGISVTPDGTDGSRATVAWTTGTNASAALTDIYLRVSTLVFADAIRMAAGLLAGTISYPLAGLIPGTAYIVTVVQRDPVTGSTTQTDFTFTAGSTTRTLSAPTNPHGIVGNTDPVTGVGHLDGTYGLDVTATELPGFVTFWEAIETGIGTGTYGSFTQVSGRVPSVSGGPTIWRGVSNNALLRKQLKARHESDGTNPSTYTAAVTLDAWGVVTSPPLVEGLDASGVVTNPIPLPLAVANIPAISSTTGKIKPGVALDGTPYLPVHTGDAVSALTDGATVTSGAAKANAGLDASGLVTQPVPLAQATANIPAISSSTGKLKPGIALDGTPYLPVHTGDAVSALTDGPTVTSYANRAGSAIDGANLVVPAAIDFARAYTNKHLGNVPDDAGTDRRAATAAEKTGGGRANNTHDSSSRIWAPAASPIGVGTPGSPGTMTKTVRVPASMFNPVSQSVQYSRAGYIASPSSGSIVAFEAPCYVPVGATITGIRMRSYTSASPSTSTLSRIVRYDESGASTIIVTAQNFGGVTAWADTSASCSETVSSSNAYSCTMELNAGLGGSSGLAKFLYLEITYTIPDYSKGI